MVRKIKALMVDQPTFKPKHDEGRKEMQPLLNEVEIQRHAKEEPPKLILNPLPLEMKYAYWEEDEAKFVLSSCHPQHI
ncbi:hypothetical protein AAG906_038317 [Vitis piasezkii]